MLEAAANNDDLAAVVSEGAGTRQIREAQQDYPASTFWPLLPGFAARDLAVSVFSNTTAPDRLTELVPDIAPRPVFLIWAPNGGNVETMNPEFQRVGGPNVSIWSIPDAKHIKGITAQPATYERRVIGFLDDALLD